MQRRLLLCYLLLTTILLLACGALARKENNIFAAPRGATGISSINNNGVQTRTGKGGGKGEMSLPTLNLLSVSSSRSSKGKGSGKGGGGMASKSSSSNSRSQSLILEPLETQLPSAAPTNTAILRANIPPRSSDRCKANTDSGMFGSPRGDQMVVVYSYQVEAQTGVTQQQFELEILPGLEIATVDAMIPYLFGPLCGLFRTRKLQMITLYSETSAYVGISSKPFDEVMEGVDCSGPFFQRPCFVVSGFITVNSVGKSPEQVESEMLLVLQGLDDDLSAQGVDKIIFRPLITPTAASTTSPTSNPTLVSLDVGTAPDTTTDTTTSEPTVSSTEPAAVPAPEPVPEPVIDPPTDPPTNPPTTSSAEVDDRLMTDAPTIVSTVAPVPVPAPVQPSELAEPQGATGEDSTEEEEEGIAWWRWLIFAIILAISIAAIVFIYRWCDDGNQKKHGSFDNEGFDNRDEER